MLIGNIPHFGGIFDLELLNSNLNELKLKSSDSNFWDDNLRASAILKKFLELKKKLKLGMELMISKMI